MEAKGWQIDRLQRPEGLHVMVVPGHGKITREYLNDLQASVEAVRSNPKLAAKGNAAMYGMIANLPFRGMIKKEVMKMMERMYSSQGQMPMDAADTPWLVEKAAGFMHKIKSKKSGS